MITGRKVILREKRLADVRDDYTWHSDPELASLDATPPLPAIFSRYLLDYTTEMHYPSPCKQQFAVETPEGKHIGNCGYYNISETEGEAELGIMIGNRDYWDKGYGTDTINTLISHIFHQTGLNRIYLKTLKSNARAQKCFKKCGFSPCGNLDKDGYSFVLMELHRRQWEKAQAETWRHKLE
jgi:RimJ/RimL family protein N-acetyltransferase